MRSHCPLKHLIEGSIEGRTEVTGRRGRRGKQLPDGLKENRGYWKLKVEVPDRNVWKTRFGRGCGPVVRQTKERTNEYGDDRFLHSNAIPLPAYMGRYSVAGTMTRYRLEDTRIESRLGSVIFCTCPDRPWGSPTSSTRGTESLSGGRG